jgi:drug/metabolite transporter superfamily protein YnfA
MKKDKLLGLIRELLMAVGAGLLTYGVQVSAGVIEASIGAIMVVASLVWALRFNEGAETVFTLVRKLLSAAGGVGVALGVITPEKLEAMLLVVGPLISLAWSVYSKGGSLPPAVPAILLFFGMGFLSMSGTSCSFSYDPVTGRAILSPDVDAINAAVNYYAKPVDVSDPLNPEWAYYDEETGELIDPKDYAAYGIVEATK